SLSEPNLIFLTPIALPTKAFSSLLYWKYLSFVLTALTIALLNSCLICLAAVERLESPTSTTPLSRIYTLFTSGACFLKVLQKAATSCPSCFSSNWVQDSLPFVSLLYRVR